MAELDGLWSVERAGGALPPLHGVRKWIQGSHGETRVGRLRLRFDVVGTELRYRGLFTGLVDTLEPAEAGWNGRALYRGREYGRFRLRRLPTSARG